MKSKASIRQRLLLLVVAVSIPMLAVVFLVVDQLGSSLRDSQRVAMFGATRLLAGSIDSEIETYVAVGRALAASEAIEKNDLVGFYRFSVAALAPWPDSWLVLADVQGRQLFNTTQPFGVALPDVANRDPFDIALATNEMFVSDVYVGQVTKRPVVALYIPTISADKVRYVIVIAVNPAVFLRVLRRQNLPDGWLSGVIDRKGNFVARTRDHDQFVGKPASAGWRAVATLGGEGQFENTSIEGQMLYSSYATTRLGNWSVSLAAAQDVIMAPARAAYQQIAVAAFALLTLSAVLAWWMSQRIIQPLSVVRDAAKQLQAEEKISLKPTGLVEADEALLAFETAANSVLERELQFRTLANSIPQLAWMANADGYLFWLNQRCYDYTGLEYDDLKGWGWERVHDPNLFEDIRTRFVATIAKGETWQDTFPLKAADGQFRWFLSQAVPVRNSAGQIVRWFGTHTDISDQKNAADHQRILINELNHRVKNTLAVIHSMAVITSRSATDVAAFSKGLIARIMRISRTHDVLTDSKWESAGLRDLVDQELAPYKSDNPERLSLHGPNILLSPKCAVDIGMVVHELATNAAKYGALSVQQGTLELSWQYDSKTNPPHIRLNWIERNGPEVVEPKKKGFGSRLIEEIARKNLNGNAAFAFEPAGLKCQIEFPLDVSQPSEIAAA